MDVVRLPLDTFSSEIQSGSDSASLPYEPLPGTHVRTKSSCVRDNFCLYNAYYYFSKYLSCKFQSIK